MTPSPLVANARPPIAFTPSWSDHHHGPFAAPRPLCCAHFVADAPWSESAALADAPRGVGDTTVSS